jgi:hypothetical protein
MSAQQSDLSSGSYGYDFVVATTQDSINATMKEYLSTLAEPEVMICYVADAKGLPTPIAYADLMQKTKGTDPFSLPNNISPADARFQNLYAARYMVGFKARMGIPAGLAPTAIPDIVTLGGDTSAVGFNLMCEEFIVTQLTPESGYSPASWMNVAQSPGAPWMFRSSVDLRMSGVGQSAYDSLPPAVQAEIKNLGSGAFSVEQLLFDLDNAALESIPTIEGVSPGTTLYTCLQTDFMGTYFEQMKAQAAPMLGCSIVPSSTPPGTLRPTDLNMEVSPYLDSNGKSSPANAGLGTLNYLCAIQNKTLPPPVPFTWNWVDPSQEADFDGVMVINRNTFASYLQTQLLNSFVTPNCFAAWVRVNMDGLDVDYHWSLTPGQTPTITVPATGAKVLSISYSSYAEDEAGLNGDMGQMALQPSYTMDISFEGNTVTVVQHLVIWLRVQVMQTSDSANAVDIQYTDTYTLEVGQSGDLTATKTSVKVDNSKTPSSSGFLNFFTDINALNDDIATWLQQYGESNFNAASLSVMRSFVFPGGNTFAFKDVQFSDNQDLVAHITYLDPTA